MQKLSQLSPLMLRIGLAIVILWFGSNQILNPDRWLNMVPDWVTSIGMTKTLVVYLNGSFEVAAGILLVFGVLVRTLSFLLFLHMIIIISELGISPSGMRDVAIAFAFLALAIHEPDGFSIMSKKTPPPFTPPQAPTLIP